MARDESFRDYVLDQLRELPGVTARGMFGGFGLYAGTVFFGIVAGGRVYFKTTAETRPAYEKRGMEPFKPSEKQTLKRYYEVPADVLEDSEQLVDWAEGALDA
jgi:DNA transformation protein